MKTFAMLLISSLIFFSTTATANRLHDTKGFHRHHDVDYSECITRVARSPNGLTTAEYRKIHSDCRAEKEAHPITGLVGKSLIFYGRSGHLSMTSLAASTCNYLYAHKSATGQERLDAQGTADHARAVTGYDSDTLGFMDYFGYNQLNCAELFAVELFELRYVDEELTPVEGRSVHLQSQRVYKAGKHYLKFRQCLNAYGRYTTPVDDVYQAVVGEIKQGRERQGLNNCDVADANGVLISTVDPHTGALIPVVPPVVEPVVEEESEDEPDDGSGDDPQE